MDAYYWRQSKPHVEVIAKLGQIEQGRLPEHPDGDISVVGVIYDDIWMRIKYIIISIIIV